MKKYSKLQLRDSGNEIALLSGVSSSGFGLGIFGIFRCFSERKTEERLQRPGNGIRSDIRTAGRALTMSR